MEVNITPEEIDKYVKTAIIESSIGKIIKESSEKFMNEILANRYDSPIKAILHNVARELIESHIKTPENLELIKNIISEKITQEAVKSIVDKMLDKLGYVAVNFGN